MHEREKWKWSHSVVSNSQWSHGLQPTRLLRPWNFPGKSTGVGCHCLLHMIHLMAPHFFFSPHSIKIHKKQKLWLHITIAVETNSLATIFQHLGEIHTHLYRTSMWPHPQVRCPQCQTKQHKTSLFLTVCLSVHHKECASLHTHLYLRDVEMRNLTPTSPFT